MKKSIIISLIVMIAISVVMIILVNNENFIFINNDTVNDVSNYLYGEAEGEKGNIKVKLKTDNSGKIIDIEVYEFSSDYYAVPSALQQMVKNAIDDYNAENIDAISGANDTSNTFKKPVNNAVGYIPPTKEDSYDRVDLNDPEVLEMVTRIEKEQVDGSLRTGFRAYIINKFIDAEYDKNGNLATHEYLCAFMIDNNRRIIDVKFDHIGSNISFDKNGKVPTNNVRSYKFLSDRQNEGFNGICSDGYYINIYDLEKDIIKNKYLRDNKNKYENKPGYNSFINALESAMNNSICIGAKKDDTLGMSCIKELKKYKIIEPVNDVNGIVSFDTNYVVVTIDSEQSISSCFLDKLENTATITAEGKILGNRNSQNYTDTELSNTKKYSKTVKTKAIEKNMLNELSDLFTNKNLQTIIEEVTKNTNDNGYPLDNLSLKQFQNVDFLVYVEMLTNAFLDVKKIIS